MLLPTPALSRASGSTREFLRPLAAQKNRGNSNDSSNNNRSSNRQTYKKRKKKEVKHGKICSSKEAHCSRAAMTNGTAVEVHAGTAASPGVAAAGATTSTSSSSYHLLFRNAASTERNAAAPVLATLPLSGTAAAAGRSAAAPASSPATRVSAAVSVAAASPAGAPAASAVDGRDDDLYFCVDDAAADEQRRQHSARLRELLLKVRRTVAARASPAASAAATPAAAGWARAAAGKRAAHEEALSTSAAAATTACVADFLPFAPGREAESDCQGDRRRKRSSQCSSSRWSTCSSLRRPWTSSKVGVHGSAKKDTTPHNTCGWPLVIRRPEAPAATPAVQSSCCPRSRDGDKQQQEQQQDGSASPPVVALAPATAVAKAGFTRVKQQQQPLEEQQQQQRLPRQKRLRGQRRMGELQESHQQQPEEKLRRKKRRRDAAAAAVTGRPEEEEQQQDKMQERQDFFHRLHEECMEFVDWLELSPVELQRRRQLFRSVGGTARRLWPRCKVFIFGSSYTGLALPLSDLDVCIWPMGQREDSSTYPSSASAVNLPGCRSFVLASVQRVVNRGSVAAAAAAAAGSKEGDSSGGDSSSRNSSRSRKGASGKGNGGGGSSSSSGSGEGCSSRSSSRSDAEGCGVKGEERRRGGEKEEAGAASVSEESEGDEACRGRGGGAARALEVEREERKTAAAAASTTATKALGETLFPPMQHYPPVDEKWRSVLLLANTRRKLHTAAGGDQQQQQHPRDVPEHSKDQQRQQLLDRLQERFMEYPLTPDTLCSARSSNRLAKHYVKMFQSFLRAQADAGVSSWGSRSRSSSSRHRNSSNSSIKKKSDDLSHRDSSSSSSNIGGIHGAAAAAGGQGKRAHSCEEEEDNLKKGDTTEEESTEEGKGENFFWEPRHIIAIVSARVPLCRFTDAATNIQVDICFDEEGGFMTSLFIRLQMLRLPLLRPLLLLNKLLLRQRQLNQPVNGGVGSFLLFLLTYSFLQQNSHLRDPQMHARYTVGHALVDFFRYYGCEFNYRKVAIRLPPFPSPVRRNTLFPHQFHRTRHCALRVRGEGRLLPREGFGEELTVFSPFDMRNVGATARRIAEIRQLWRQSHAQLAALMMNETRRSSRPSSPPPENRKPLEFPLLRHVFCMDEAEWKEFLRSIRPL